MHREKIIEQPKKKEEKQDLFEKYEGVFETLRSIIETYPKTLFTLSTLVTFFAHLNVKEIVENRNPIMTVLKDTKKDTEYKIERGVHDAKNTAMEKWDEAMWRRVNKEKAEGSLKNQQEFPEPYQGYISYIQGIVEGDVEKEAQDAKASIDGRELFVLGISLEEMERGGEKINAVVDEAVQYTKEKRDKGDAPGMEEIYSTFFMPLVKAQNDYQQSAYRLVLTGKGSCDARNALFTILLQEYFTRAGYSPEIFHQLGVDDFAQYTDLSGVERAAHTEISYAFNDPDETLLVFNGSNPLYLKNKNRTRWNIASYYAIRAFQEMGLEPKKEPTQDYTKIIKGSPYFYEQTGDLVFRGSGAFSDPIHGSSEIIHLVHNDLIAQERALHERREVREKQLRTEALGQIIADHYEDIERIKNERASQGDAPTIIWDTYGENSKFFSEMFTKLLQEDEEWNNIVRELQRVIKEQMEISDAEVFTHANERKEEELKYQELMGEFDAVLAKYQGEWMLDSNFVMKLSYAIREKISKQDLEKINEIIRRFNEVNDNISIYLSERKFLFNAPFDIEVESRKEWQDDVSFTDINTLCEAMKKYPKYAADMDVDIEMLPGEWLTYQKLLVQLNPYYASGNEEKMISKWFRAGEGDISLSQEMAAILPSVARKVNFSSNFIRGDIEIFPKEKLEYAFFARGEMTLHAKQKGEYKIILQNYPIVDNTATKNNPLKINIFGNRETMITVDQWVSSHAIYLHFSSNEGNIDKIDINLGRNFFLETDTYIRYVSLNEEGVFNYYVDLEQQESFFEALQKYAEERGEKTVIEMYNLSKEKMNENNLNVEMMINQFFKRFPNLTVRITFYKK